MIKSSDLLSILITFAVGFFSGGYLYLTVMASSSSKASVPDQVAASEFTITSDVYGGCRDACPSFHVNNDGSYRYLFKPVRGEDSVLRQGNLPPQLHKRLRQVLTKSQLEAQSKSVEPLICNSYTDGIDVKYEISLNNKKFLLDSCGTAVVGEGQLWSTLSSVWTYFETEGGSGV